MKKLLKTKEDRLQFLTWIAFLKAGVFKQARGVAQSEGEEAYCIIATLVVLFVPEQQLRTAATESRRQFDHTLWGLSGNMVNLPHWCRAISADYATKANDVTVISLNDTRGYTFNQIADKLLEIYADELAQQD